VPRAVLHGGPGEREGEEGGGGWIFRSTGFKKKKLTPPLLPFSLFFFQWFGRSCAPYSLIGPKVDYALGYAEYNIAAPNLANLTAAIKAPLAAAGSELLAKLGALEAKKAGLMGGAAPVGGGTAATTAAVDGAGNGGREDKKAEKAAAKEDKKAAKEEEGRGSGAPSAAGGASSGR
jgi:hypothetical protein